MSTHTMIHDAHEIEAVADESYGAPFTVKTRCRGELLSDNVTFFTDDFELSRKIAEAINETVREHNAALAAKQDAA